jgi:hypothetical protein
VKCTVCKEDLDPVLESSTTHPTCFTFAELDEGDPFATMLKTRLIDVILWAQSEVMNPRSKQSLIGPSELGTICDRRIGYRVAGIPKVNVDVDPWPMVVGTAVHSWLERAFTVWNEANTRTPEWATETRLNLDQAVQGTSDLYSYEYKAVIDWKGAGPDVMKKVRRDGPPVGYQIQAHLYGYGYTLQGLPVEKVCLVFLPRAGWLKDMYVWCDDYSQDVALGAIMRLYRIATDLTQMDISKHPNSWNDVPAHPSNDCGFCPWYRPSESEASDQGCPGR